MLREKTVVMPLCNLSPSEKKVKMDRLLYRAEIMFYEQGHSSINTRANEHVSRKWNAPDARTFFEGKRKAFLRCDRCERPVIVSPDGVITGEAREIMCDK